ncbi:terpenoid synthase [Coniophora puteana RWD-64-598 SS2]|uniref:Terpene synthase n=1 Tax=Coniophora puteana (strain RWD-64-598) TaxID=741705 RepID=A0A5M3MKY2_CONPW|nr:terpenoid synthase [Coniophora puteana RWD-64-598 SS2]EIW79743.1 terpenoid synthase [Coniophora puteana RWD-64-598 SS2]
MTAWPWPRRVSPHLEKVGKEATEWLHSLAPFNPKSLAAFNKCNFCLLAALSYPQLDESHFRTACDLIFFFFVVDEYTDVGSAPVVQELVNVMMNAFEHPHEPRPEGESILGELSRQFWARAIKIITPEAQRHFMDSVTQYLKSVVTQAADRDANVCRNIHEYLLVRRETVGVRVAFTPAEAPLSIPDDIFFHPSLQALSDCVIELVIIDNDIVSYNREQTTGDENHNLITVVRRELGCSLDDAFVWAARYHAEIQERFHSRMGSLPSWGPRMDDEVKQYVEGMAYWVRGNHAWSYEGQRYFGSRGVEIQKTRKVPLLDKVDKSGSTAKEQEVMVDVMYF